MTHKDDLLTVLIGVRVSRRTFKAMKKRMLSHEKPPEYVRRVIEQDCTPKESPDPHRD